MENQKICCEHCSHELADILNGNLSFTGMKFITILELNLMDNSKEVKCDKCGFWNKFDRNNQRIKNYNRDSVDPNYNENTIVYRKLHPNFNQKLIKSIKTKYIKKHDKQTH